jgi:hypothetical protein
VRTWRRLQQIGAIPVKQSVYVLPDSPATREDFEWLKTEVNGAGGAAAVFAAESVDAADDETLIQEHRRARDQEYAALADDIEHVISRVRGRGRAPGTRAPAVRRLADLFRERLAAIERIDFFGARGRQRVETLLDRLSTVIPPHESPTPANGASPADARRYRNRVWVTRPRPGVDRMASAWLIRRFIDRRARFAFAADVRTSPSKAIPFDMYGAAFSHHAEQCTFETLCAVFRLHDAALTRVAAIVHDLDLKDGRFGAPEASTVGAMIDGLQLAHHRDTELLAQGMALFDALYRSFQGTPHRRPRHSPASSRQRR